MNASDSYQVPHDLPRLFSRPDRLHDPLYVVTTVFNSPRYRTRWKLYQDFALRVERAGAKLYTVEVAFGDRDFSVTDPANPQHLQLRTSSELWLKENAINLGVARLPADWKYVAWVDADIAFVRDDWANETIHALQHYKVVQMWSEAQDLSPDHELHQKHQSFAWCWNHLPQDPTPSGPYYYAPKRGGKWMWHPGYAWACRRSVWDALGGLLDVCPLGAGDMHMAWGMVGEIERSIDRRMHREYIDHLRQWGQRAQAAVNLDIGMVPGLILHHWHGPKAARQYATRGQILTQEQFSPLKHLYRDWQGLWQIAETHPKLRNRIREYFRQRDEDSTHFEGA